mgnify:CR=1 FL=1
MVYAIVETHREDERETYIERFKNKDDVIQRLLELLHDVQDIYGFELVRRA